MATNGGVTTLLKDAVGRERPDLEYADPDVLSARELKELQAKKDGRRSFPSAHASASFAYVSYLERTLARRLGIRSSARAVSFGALYGTAGYIGYSRIRDDRHYLSDVVAGAALGVTVSRAYYRLNHAEEFRVRGHRSGRLDVRIYPPIPIPGGPGLFMA